MVEKKRSSVVFPTVRKTKRADGRLRVQVVPDPSRDRAKQSFKDECDINNVMRKYMKTGQLPDRIKQNAAYGDFSSPESFLDSMNTVMFATEQFSLLPAGVRARFDNDPALFLAFADDPKNGPELVKMGLATAPEPPGPSSSGPEAPEAKSKAKGSKAPVSDDDA